MSGLLSRWNQRREQVAKEAELEAKETPNTLAIDDANVTETTVNGAEVASNEAGAVTDTPDAEEALLTAEDLPDPENIEVGGSFASFMAKNVDPAAKAAALRALWKQPQYGHIDGLLEYALDYSNQPKLSADVSAELAKKVFKHVIEKEDKEQQESEQGHTEPALANDTVLPDEQADNVEDNASDAAESEVAQLENDSHDNGVNEFVPSDELSAQIAASDEAVPVKV
ncbi:DUF3306 domain-containing protein [Shewanella gaetbuli]|uniref:DUF3306 domain-containing protein n=1 Tax=Shewanella gaetbuli TaxID=220752 RepID=A0A9X2CI64_9GAMM|nr:DUF3306 domain-containing protein [Shewanella gaetbuli]MCL1144258.1 DUF3306 domain-containing protein [Shewanella gaetbuli]